MRFYAIGGYSEFGRNMCAIEVGNEVVICDMGVRVDKLVEIEEKYQALSTKKLVSMGAIPDDKILHGKNVAAIVISHAHLDHCEAIPRLAERYNCPIVATPYTTEVIRRLIKSEDVPQLARRLNPIRLGGSMELSNNFEVEMMAITHSIPQSALVALRTKEGTVVYLNDYKLDDTPTIGEKPDYRAFKKLGKEGVKLFVLESVRASEPGHTPSELVAKIMMQDTMKKAYETREGIVFVTTFASHIARIKSIIEANQGKKRIAIMGRSMIEYMDPAKEMRLIDTSSVEIFAKKRKGVGAALEKIRKRPEEWLVITTGHQGEPNSVLSRIARREYTFQFSPNDRVIFSSDTIPVPINIANRTTLQNLLRSQGVRLFDNIHVSGHARREDDRDMIRMLNAEAIVPSHGDREKLVALASLAEEEGYSIGKNVLVLHNGAEIER